VSRLIILGATGSLGRHVLRQALAEGHRVTVLVRNPFKLPPEAQARVAVEIGDLDVIAPRELARLARGHDALVNCAGHVTQGEGFVELFDRLVDSLDSLPAAEQPVSWFLAGAALLDIDPSGRRGVDLPNLKSTYRPHRINFERLGRSELDWRLLCPGPMVEEPALGVDRLRISLDRVPVEVPAFARGLPGPLFLPVFASLVLQMTVPYADAAALILANLDRGGAMTRHRVGLALPPGMRGHKPLWTAKPPEVIT